MVVAHLQGLLSKNHKYGGRSYASEEIIFEAISSNLLADGIKNGCESDLSLVPVLTQKGVIKTLEKVTARLDRAAELRMFDVYKVAEQISGKLKQDNPEKELSLFQLYQIAEKTGIFDAFDEHYTLENSKPLL